MEKFLFVEATGFNPASCAYLSLCFTYMLWNGREMIDFLRENGSTGKIKQQMNTAAGKAGWVIR